MKLFMVPLMLAGLAVLGSFPSGAQAQTSPGPLRIEITEGVIEPLPFAWAVSHRARRRRPAPDRFELRSPKV